MNAFYKISDIIKSRLENNPNVKTIKFSSQDHSDLNDKNIYPLCYLNPMGSSLSEDNSVVEFTFEVAAMDQRSQSNEYLTDKYTGNHNLIDNLNITHTILTDLQMYLRTDPDDVGIEISRVSEMSPIFSQQVNLLDGWVFTITIKMVNTQC